MNRRNIRILNFKKSLYLLIVIIGLTLVSFAVFAERNKTPPPTPEESLPPTPDANEGWAKWSCAYWYDPDLYYWDDNVLWQDNDQIVEGYATRTVYLNQQTGTDGPHQPWNNFDGDGFKAEYGLYKELEAPPGEYTLLFDVWVYEHARFYS